MQAPDPTCETIQRELSVVHKEIRDFVNSRSSKPCIQDPWNYQQGSGGGLSCVWEGAQGDLLEKGGVLFSGITGEDLPAAAATQFSIPKGTRFTATGISLVLHPWNPNVPTIHMNVRYFEAGTEWWFGGGIDLTPYYPRMGQVITFHRKLKELCEKHGQPYDQYKQTCDEYFTNKHRGEMRGCSGIFFDHLRTPSKRAAFDFIVALGRSFNALYGAFVDANRDMPYTPTQREFQLIRRSRYVEFNLLYDRGTKFGLQSSGRTESILVSMPAVAHWHYNWQPAPNSEEEQITKLYFQPRDWANTRLPPSAPLAPEHKVLLAFLAAAVGFAALQLV